MLTPENLLFSNTKRASDWHFLVFNVVCVHKQLALITDTLKSIIPSLNQISKGIYFGGLVHFSRHYITSAEVNISDLVNWSKKLSSISNNWLLFRHSTSQAFQFLTWSNDIGSFA